MHRVRNKLASKGKKTLLNLVISPTWSLLGTKTSEALGDKFLD